MGADCFVGSESVSFCVVVVFGGTSLLSFAPRSPTVSLSYFASSAPGAAAMEGGGEFEGDPFDPSPEGPTFIVDSFSQCLLCLFCAMDAV